MRKIKNRCIKIILAVIMLFFSVSGFAQKPYRQGTTAANFLEIGFGTAGSSMGDTYASVGSDLSSVYWNPAGLAFMEQNEVQFNYQPWLVNINTIFAGVGLVFRNIGTFALSFYQVGYGSMEVTTLEMQEGTGEQFDANDIAVGVSYSRKLAPWFSFGVTGKYISSQIWHTNASAFAVDVGVIVQTQFFSTSGDREDGMKIGMSISNFGTKMKYGGIDLLNPIDILPYEHGNYKDVPGKFSLEGWELPLIFRVGFSIDPVVTRNHRLTIAMDALHPNNNSESINIGAQYQLTIPTGGTFYLRCGYKALFMEESEYGPAFGGGIIFRMMHNIGLKVEYAYRGIGILGNIHSTSLGILF